MRVVFYVLGGLLIAFGLFFPIRTALRGIESAPLPYFMCAATGFVFLVIGGALGRSRRLLVIASLVAVAAMSATVWAVMTEKPPPCADDVTEAGSLAYIRPWLQGIGYSATEVDSFRVTNISKFAEEAWPTYAFYFTGTRNGKTQGVLGVGNGCGIGDLQESRPFTIRKIG